VLAARRLVGGSNVFGVLPVWDHLPRTSVYWNQQLTSMNPIGPNRNKGLRGKIRFANDLANR